MKIDMKNQVIWNKPPDEILTAYQKSYVDKVPAGNLPDILRLNGEKTLELLRNLTETERKYIYADGKWSIAQILVHIIDTERIFAYRALRIARGDKTPLPAFEENDYAKNSNANERDFEEILEEYDCVRKATVSLLKSFTNEMLQNIGVSSNMNVTVNAIIYMLAGHEIHHVKVLKERYLRRTS